MAPARQAAISLTNIRTRVRQVTGDTDTDTDNQSFSDALIDNAVNDMLVEMQNKMNGPQVGAALVSTSLSYTGDSTALPTAANYETIYKVEDISDTSKPVELTYVDPEEIERWAISNSNLTNNLLPSHRFYTILGATTTTRSIALRPTATVTLRIHYVASPIIYGAAADTLPLSPRWQELVARGAGERLLSIDGDSAYNEKAIILARLWGTFLAFGQTVRGPQRVTRVRRGR